MSDVHQIEHFLTDDGKKPLAEWTRHLRDTRLRIAINRRLNRLALGNFGDHKFCRDGVWELRIDFGPGYRVYYGFAGSQVILPCGGDKKTQNADISRACAWWLRYQQRGLS